MVNDLANDLRVNWDCENTTATAT